MSPSPAQDDASLTQEVRAMIRLQDVSSMGGSLGRLVLGAGVCLGAGLVLATLITTTLYGMFDTTVLGWWGWLLAYFFVLVPLLIWQEKNSRFDYVNESISSLDSKPSSQGEHALSRAGLTVSVIASWLVWGPRALIDGFRGMRGRRTMAQEAVFDRAAMLVVDLSKFDGGIAIKKLLHANENMQIFGSSVDLLDMHGWIGKSSDGRSLWLNSTFRQKLLASAQGARGVGSGRI